MAYTEAQKRATLKYKAEHMVKIQMDVKPEEKTMVADAAAAAGKSVKAYLLDLVRQDLK